MNLIERIADILALTEPAGCNCVGCRAAVREKLRGAARNVIATLSEDDLAAELADRRTKAMAKETVP